MRVTDDSDKVIINYDPLLDNEIDIDAPYIDYSYALDQTTIEEPSNGVYDTLFYNDTKILIVGKIAEVEIRFYSTENPNEKYRTGQKHFKGKIMDIQQIQGESGTGYTIRVDTSKEWYGKVENLSIGREYVEKTKTRCIAILTFNEHGRIISELIIPIADWFSSKVYLNSAIVFDETTDVAYKVGDIVDLVIYVKVKDEEAAKAGKIKVKNEDVTGRICDLQLTQRAVTEIDEDGVSWTRTVYYYIVSIDKSTQYNKSVLKIASTVIRSMVLHPIIPEV